MNEPISVTQFNQLIEETLGYNPRLFDIIVTGEISNLTYHSSGHVYFSLKDKQSSIKINYWRTYVQRLPYRLENGMQIEVKGSISVYIPNGSYALNIKEIKQVGTGALQALFEKNLQYLKDNNLIHEPRKLIKYPERIAILTSKTGAALQDIKKTFSDVYPIVSLDVYNVVVQGPNIAQSLICGLEKIYYNYEQYDLIIIARGGGSIEDLWGFNDLNLAIKVSQSPIPVISAIGHEINYVLTDYVADYRAATPTAAVQISVPNVKTIISELTEYNSRLNSILLQKISSLKTTLYQLESNVYSLSPLIKLNQYLTKLSTNEQYLINGFQNKLNYYDQIITNQKQKLNDLIKSKDFEITAMLDKLKNLKQQNISIYNQIINNHLIRLQINERRLHENNIQSNLDKGYAIITSLDNQLIKNYSNLLKNKKIKIRLADSETIFKIEKEHDEN